MNSANSGEPAHLVALEGGRWALWRWAALRGAGFPAYWIYRLSSPECAAAADRLLLAEKVARRARSEALVALRDELEGASPDGRFALERAVRRLQRGKLPQALDKGWRSGELVQQFREALARIQSARAEYLTVYEDASGRLALETRELAGDERFREAVIWQNRAAFHNAIEALLRKPIRSTNGASKRRQHEELVARYLQRYCVKNETIGFFGPVGWARLGVGQGLSAGAELWQFSTRRVYFESWCIDALAASIGRDLPGLRPWMRPRLVASAEVWEQVLYQASRAPRPLAARAAQLLGLCDGQRTARELAEATGLGETALYGLLERFEQADLVVWQLEVPYEPGAEKELRRRLMMVGEAGLREEALGRMERLEAARERVERAAGSAAALDQALGELEREFTELTGEAAGRAAGKMYAGRGLVYEECARGGEVEVGSELLGELSGPLGLMLEGARWLTARAAGLARGEFERAYEELTGGSGGEVECVRYWGRISRSLMGVGGLAEVAEEEAAAGWERILGAESEEWWAAREVKYESKWLASRVEEEFGGAETAWASARYHSPDLMVEAESVEAVRRGEYRLVLGELHVATNTLDYWLFVGQHPCPEELLQAAQADLPHPRLVPVTPRDWPNITVRTLSCLVSPADYRLVFSKDTNGVLPEQAVPIGSLVVAREAGRLIVRTRDGRLRFDGTETFATIISFMLVNNFGILSPRQHAPRIVIDRMVVARESWRNPCQGLTFALEATPERRFLEARRWAKRLGLPRLLFARAGDERKPVFVDLESPVYVEMLARSVRGASDGELALTEMLPEPGQCWLTDPAGNRYTSELRLVAVDLLGKSGENAGGSVAR